MYRIYRLDDGGLEETSLGYYQTIEEADDAIDHFWNEFPNTYIDIKEVD